MKASRKPSPSGKKGPPGWIVSFTDMITLLLAFFVLLQAFAKMQDPDLFHIGRDSFRRAIAGLGIPNLLFGKQDRARFDFRKQKHPAEEAENEIPRNRALDAEDEKIRKGFEDLRRSMEPRSSDVQAELLDKRIPPIAFEPGRAELDAAARGHLSELAIDLQQNLPHKGVKVYVIGLAGDERAGKSRWLISARRAWEVQRFLEQSCAPFAKQRRWAFASWGAGAGGKWLEKLGRLGDQSYVVIVITKERG